MEAWKILQFSLIRAFDYSYYAVAVPTMMFVGFVLVVYIGEELTTSAVFSTLSHLSFLSISLLIFTKAILNLSDCHVGLKRISVSTKLVNIIVNHYVFSIHIG